MENVDFQIVDKVSAKGTKYSALQITLKSVNINGLELGDMPLSPIFISPTELAVLRALLQVK